MPFLVGQSCEQSSFGGSAIRRDTGSARS